MTEELNQEDWGTKLLEVEYAINNSIHSVCQVTPDRLLFRVEQRVVIIDEFTSSEREILRKIYGPLRFGDGEYRRRWNDDMYELYNDMGIVRRIKIQRLRCTEGFLGDLGDHKSNFPNALFNFITEYREKRI